MRPRGVQNVDNQLPSYAAVHPKQQRPQLHSGKSLIPRRFVVIFSVRLGQARLDFHVVRANSAKFSLHARQHEISALPRNSKYTYVYNYM